MVSGAASAVIRPLHAPDLVLVEPVDPYAAVQLRRDVLVPSVASL
jgi:hypothetical protein